MSTNQEVDLGPILLTLMLGGLIAIIIGFCIYGDKNPDGTPIVHSTPSSSSEDSCPEGFLTSLFETGKCMLEKRGYTQVESHHSFGLFGCGSRYKTSGFKAFDPKGKRVYGNICKKKKGLFRDVEIEFHEEY